MRKQAAILQLDEALLRSLAEEALLEDRAYEDATTAALIPQDQQGRAVIIAKAEGVIAGLPMAAAVFQTIDSRLQWRPLVEEGAHLHPRDPVVEVEGALGSILRGERVGLNFLQHLSGIATAAARIVEELKGTSTLLRDTRKTLPGLRALEKYAVRIGGGTNHRLNLADGVLIKDNHLAALRAQGLGIADAIRMARKANPRLPIEVEVTTVEEAKEALAAAPDELLLDNMSPATMAEIVALAATCHPRPGLEASGNITLENIRQIAESGVDYASSGALTHSVKALDLSLKVEPL